MASTVLIPIEDIDIRVSGVPIRDVAVTGTYLLIEKLSARSTPVEGMHGSLVHVTANGTAYRVTLTVLQGSTSDISLYAAMTVSHNSSSVLSFSYIVKKTVYTSVNCRIDNDPTRELAGDGSPMSVYAMVGTFPIIVVGGFGVPDVVTPDQIAAAIPV